MTKIVFEQLFLALDRDGDGVLSVQEMCTGVAMLNQVNEFGKILARLLQAAASGGASDPRTLTRDRWNEYASRTAYDDNTLESFEAVVRRLCPDQQWRAAKDTPVAQSGGSLGSAPPPNKAPSPPETSKLPPGFQAVPSRSEPGQIRYFDPINNVKYATLTLAWQAYEHNQASAGGASHHVERQQPQQQASARHQAAPRSPRSSDPSQTRSASPRSWMDRDSVRPQDKHHAPAVGSQAPAPTVQLQPLPTQQQQPLPSQANYSEASADRGRGGHVDTAHKEHRSASPTARGPSMWSQAIFGPRKEGAPVPVVYTAATRNWDHIRRVDVPGYGPVEGATSLARLLLPRLKTSKTEGWDTSD
eukprot:CAMPEP_0178372716 /NCGR_PEP_ID=MMETSP0689_2-20121128/1497_1 /TAXON_ID=160604 /ORGANISM="Amphidinium massartii, Strain CS-259" /LENGTH=359 /DNA_ID=CAMNT_0019992649 /DNA_START=55 /DNA_END=1131 /DNA_ORIENTATION=+